MAEAKTRPTKTSLASFLDSVPDAQRRADCEALAAMMKQVTGAPAVVWGTSIVGFGTYHYTYASGRTGDWPVVAFAPRKNDLTVYVMPGFDGLGDLLQRLGPHKTAKVCLYLKRLADVDRTVLAEIIERSVAAMASQRVS